MTWQSGPRSSSDLALNTYCLQAVRCVACWPAWLVVWLGAWCPALTVWSRVVVDWPVHGCGAEGLTEKIGKNPDTYELVRGLVELFLARVD